MHQISIALALAVAVFAASTASVPAQETRPTAKTGPARTSAAAAKPAVEIVRVPSDNLQRRRRAIAESFEAHRWNRGLIAGGAAKIAEAGLAGPFEYTTKKMFSSETISQTLYCVKVRLDLPLAPPQIALIRVERPKEGGERMLMTMRVPGDPWECRKADYKPFPELAQLRTQRRRALGHAD